MGNWWTSHSVSTDWKRRVCESQDAYVHSILDSTDSVGQNNLDVSVDSDDDEKINRTSLLGLGTSGPVDRCSYDDVDSRTLQVVIRDYEFPFENLVFEGGGNKGLAYCGAIQVLEEIGAYQNIKRFAGTSAGAMTAALLAVGYNSEEIREFLSQDLSKIFIDHSWGYLSLLPNLLTNYGWNPGERIYEWFGEVLREKTGNPDITFKNIYTKYSKELCIVVTNLNMMTEEYFHVKTTPDVPIRIAVRMSMAIPGLFQAKKYELNGVENVYVDGGVLCNYPINCFDGWWLSLKMEDSFLNRLQPLEMIPKLCGKKERFGTFNEATLGFLLYADNEKDILQEELQKRVGTSVPQFPDTKLGREKARLKDVQKRVDSEYRCNLHAVTAFFKVLQKHNINRDDKINKLELSNAMKDTEFSEEYAEKLFGRNVTVDDVMEALDEDCSGEVDFNELVHFIERTGVSLQTRFLGYQRTEVNGLFSFFDTLQSALLTNVKRIYVEVQDTERTVGINTGHVGTSDFILELEDRNYVVMQGRRATEAFLRYYIVKHDPPKRT